MTLRQQALDFIAAHEGVVLKAYRDPVGIWTIGIGHTTAAGPPEVVPGMTITREQALEIFARDLRKYEKRVDQEMPRVGQHVLEGGTSFDFNTGGIFKATWPDHYKGGRLDKAEASILAWNKAGTPKRALPGLTRRRREEWDIIARGRYPADTPTAENRSHSVSREAVENYQRQLRDLGYYAGVIDGIDGPKTDDAVRRFQRDHDLKVDGVVGPATRATLIRALERRRANTQTGAGAAGGAAGGAGTAVEPDPSSIPDVSGLPPRMILWALAGAVVVAGVVALYWWVKRNRGALTGRRQPT